VSTVAFGLIAFMLAIYVLLDGYDLGVAAILAAHEEHARAHRAHHDHHVKAALEAWRDAAAAELKRAGEAARDEAAAHV